jgi:hypothetical protein
MIPPPNDPWAGVIAGQLVRQAFYAVYADGREERLISITVLNGELLYETLERTAIEIGAVKIVIKPEEAQAVVV